VTKDELLAQAIRNEMRTNQAQILVLQGENNGLAKVLDKLEGGSIVAGEPPSARVDGGSEHSSSPVANQSEGAGGGEGQSSRVGDEGATPGTDGGAA